VRNLAQPALSGLWYDLAATVAAIQQDLATAPATVNTGAIREAEEAAICARPTDQDLAKV
jgi:hypothetical protein